MFKVYNRDNRMTSWTSWTYFTPLSSASNADYNPVIACQAIIIKKCNPNA